MNKTNGHNGHDKLTVYEHTKGTVNLFVGQDFLTCALGELGFSMKTICEMTGHTVGRVHYRLKKGGVSISAYRTGQSAVAKKVLVFAKQKLTPTIEANLIKALKAPAKKTEATIDV